MKSEARRKMSETLMAMMTPIYVIIMQEYMSPY